MNAASMKRIPTLAILLMMSMIWACDGDDGAAGPAGPQGPQGPAGPPAPVPDPVTAAIEKAQPESCVTCHDKVGVEVHQSLYDKYTDGTRLAMTFDDLSSSDNLDGTYTLTLTYSVTRDNAPILDGLTAGGDPNFLQARFYAATYNAATRQYLDSCRFNENYQDLGGGQYSVQDTNCSYAPELQTGAGEGAQVYGYIAEGALLEHEGGTGSEIPTNHVHLYDDLASAALAYGTANAASGESYQSYANVAGCEKCHGKPYLKHGFRDPIVAGLPDFASCKVCHVDDREGGHEDWQYMVDDPANWATAGLAKDVVETKYAYTANVMNDTHMAHAMEFPYPQSMANCATCHDGNLTQILDNSYFAAETCKSCHPVEGLGAWPEFAGMDEGPYYQSHRAPPLTYLWAAADAEFHDIGMTCTNCHGDPGVPTALTFDQLHSGYDRDTYDDAGGRYATMYTVSIDSITRDGNELTIQYSSNDPTISYWLAVSFYGWDSKHFIVPSHERDTSENRLRFEYIPPNANPLFAETANSAPGAWEVVVDMAGWVGNPDSVVNLIAANKIRRAEVSLLPTITIDGERKKLNAVSTTFDLVANAVDPDWFKLDNAIVDVGKCNVCHDRLNFHDGFGLGIGGESGDRLVCVNCHNPTFAGSHLEMASRSIENYVHSIHSFQNFDVGDVFGSNGYDPVDALRYDQHIKHVFPNFTIRNCEACHLPGTYEVPDQTQSMPGLQAASDSPTTWYTIVSSGGNIPSNIPQEKPEGRNIGTIQEAVTGPASRACGGCHRARFINQDQAGGLASFNGHVDIFGTYVDDNPPEDTDDEVLFGIIDKLMTWFE